MRTYNNLKGSTSPKHVDNLRHLVRSSAEAFGNKPLYIWKEDGVEKTVSYQEHYEHMNAFGTALSLYGLMGRRIAVIGDTHPEWITTFKAVVNAGSVIVPLDRELDVDQIINFMKIAGCTAIVYTKSFNKRLTSREADMPFIKYFIPINKYGEDLDNLKVLPFDEMLYRDAVALEEGNVSFTEYDIDIEKLCAILFTSGTTGTSKGVMLNQRNLTAATNSASQSMACFDTRTTYVSVLPIHHTYELVCAHFATSNEGSTTYICESLRYATRAFKEFKPNCLVLVPLFLETIHKKIWEEIRKNGLEKKVRAAMAFSDSLLKANIDIRSKTFSDITAVFGGNLKSIVVGGAPLDPQIVKDFYSFGISVLQGFGITECAPLVAVNRIGHVKFDSVGQVVENCEVRLARIPGEADGEGEILVRGDNVMMGYYENELATKEAFTEDGWFRTGDIGKIDRHGYITITGRLKNVIIASNGKNIYPEEIEEYLAKIEEIKECVVVGRKGEGPSDVVITALIVPNMELLGEDCTDSKIKTILKEKIADINRVLPAYKHINRFEIRHEDFERNLSKKIKRFLIK